MPQIVVTTQHNDNSRTGANLQEEVLNVQNVNSQQFGMIFKRPVDGQIFAQPLYVPNLNIPGKGVHNVVYVATMHNSVYAFDADDPAASTPLWHMPLGPSAPLPDSNIGPPTYKDISTEVGILSTPVISLEQNAIYVVAFTKTSTSTGPQYFYKLHALDLTNGAEKFNGPVQIQASVKGSGAGSVNGMVTFTANRQIQRAALLLTNNIVYIAFAAFGDKDPYHGWVFGYDAVTLQPVHDPYNTTTNGGRGGIWQAGQGPAADDGNNLYFFTGNGDFNGDQQNPPTTLGDSSIKLRPDLTLADWFTPKNNAALNKADYDLGSSGPLLLPGTNLLVGGGKEGKFYLLDRNQLGHIGRSVQDFYVSPPDDPNNPYPGDPTKSHHIHGGPVYWNGPNGAWAYVWPENEFLKAFKLANGDFLTNPVSQSSTIDPTGAPGGSHGMPGGMLSISANENTPGSGILWASHPFNEGANHAVVEGIVRAYDASDLSRELWNSKQKPARDDIGNFAKFCPPTVANGKVYMASFSDYLAVYGLLPYQKEVLQETAIGGPALMNMNDTNLSLAWTGTDPQHHLNVALSNDGLTFDRQATLSATSSDGPGFAFGSGLSFLAWTGTNPQHHLNVARSNDGLTFDRQITLGESSPFGPALAFGNGRLYLAWASTDTNHSLNVLSSIDGVNFTNKVTLGDTSVSAPALSFINGILYLLWCGRDNNHSLNIMESKDGMTFTNKVTLNDSSDVHPAMVAMIKQSGLLLAWTGRDSKHHLNLRFGGDIHSLSNKLTYMYGEESTAGPALATFNEKIYVGWTATDSAHHINIAVLS